MAIPTFEILNKNIMEWVQKNFGKAMLPYNADKGDFKPEHSKVIEFPKVWKENDYWLVEAQVEYVLKQSEFVRITFQIDDAGKIIGYSIHKSSVTY
jgi:hypothetical protein